MIKGKIECPFEDAIEYRIPGNIAPTLGVGGDWHASGSGNTHSEATRILNDNNSLHYGTPENKTEDLPIVRTSNG